MKLTPLVKCSCCGRLVWAGEATAQSGHHSPILCQGCHDDGENVQRQALHQELRDEQPSGKVTVF